jgi:DNA modification methylase
MSVQDVLDGKRLSWVECGDSAAVLSGWPAECVQTSICSPPYFALRSYLPKGHKSKAVEIGSEDTVEAFLDRLLAIFREVRRVLVPHGTLFCNLGDSYASSGGPGASGKQSFLQRYDRADNRTEAGNLLMVPARFALAMQADGWILRSAMVWSKPAPLPESVSGWRWARCRVKTGNVPYDGKLGGYGNALPDRERALDNHKVALWRDCPGCRKCRANGGMVLRKGSWRPTRSHEMVFMFAKSAQYFCDGEPVRTALAATTRSRDRYSRILDDPEEQFAVKHNHETIGNPAGANLRDVLSISSEPQGEFVLPDGRRISHFAAFPSRLVETLILCATSAKGHCPRCMMPVARILERNAAPASAPKKAPNRCLDLGVQRGLDMTPGAHTPGWREREPEPLNQTIGWKPSCSCPEAESPAADVVLDPFAGTSTTGITALRLGRRYLGIDLCQDYVDLSKHRLSQEMPLFNL